MKTMVDRKLLIILLCLLFCLLFLMLYLKAGVIHIPDDYHASNSSGWVRLNYQVNLLICTAKN